MRLSRERLQREATATGFRVEILEKAAQLLDLLCAVGNPITRAPNRIRSTAECPRLGRQRT